MSSAPIGTMLQQSAVAGTPPHVPHAATCGYSGPRKQKSGPARLEADKAWMTCRQIGLVRWHLSFADHGTNSSLCQALVGLCRSSVATARMRQILSVRTACSPCKYTWQPLLGTTHGKHSSLAPTQTRTHQEARRNSPLLTCWHHTQTRTHP